MDSPPYEPLVYVLVSPVLRGPTVLGAVMSNDTEGALRLIWSGGDPNEQDGENNSPMHYAVMNNNMEILDNLIWSGADPNFRNTMGETPLHLAVNSEEMVRRLLRSGADPSIVDNNRRMPYTYASGNIRRLLMVDNDPYEDERRRGEMCSICLGEEGNKLLTRCGHAFHGECIGKLFGNRVRQKCPICRETITLGDMRFGRKRVLRFRSIRR